MYVLIAILSYVLFLAEGKEVKTLQPKIIPNNLKPFFVHERIIAGNEVDPHSFIFQVGLFIDVGFDTGFCGGTLISRRYVLTAGHCCAGARSLEIAFGAHNITTSEDSQLRMVSTKYKIHEEFLIFFGLNDVCLVELPEEVQLSDKIGLVKLPSKQYIEESFEDEKATIVGWGRTSDEEYAISDVLRKTNTEVISNDECLESYFVIQPTHICTDCSRHNCPCNGDSGGPLLAEGIQIGIVSFGSANGCSDSAPGAYSRVTSFLDWIEANSDVIIDE